MDSRVYLKQLFEFLMICKLTRFLLMVRVERGNLFLFYQRGLNWLLPIVFQESFNNTISLFYGYDGVGSFLVLEYSPSETSSSPGDLKTGDTAPSKGNGSHRSSPYSRHAMIPKWWAQ
ncbi:hypothetical protein HAX54_052694 [Datura stramonium]|uniref:Uncharacterized protein n=1 Tax=Datura stramonium TaxID=4076 RepID=A0ABS8WRE0_DATST|nr:hypothetical protein [Datura stramonium]